MKKIKIAIFGLAHPHASVLYKTFALWPDEVEFLGYADVPPYDDMPHEDRKRYLGKAGVEALHEYADWRELAALGPNLAIVTTDNRACGEVCCELMSRGIAVLNEKPMAMDYEDAKRMYACSKKYGVPIITNWPIAWFPTFRMAKQLADEGRIGRVMRVTYRSPATWGPFSYGHPLEDKNSSWWYRHERGGGSVLDYACYGTVLSTWIFGRRAERVSAITKNFTVGFSDVEDYSAMILDFGDGVGLLEGSWSTFNCGEVPTGPVIYGTEGTIVCDRHSNLLKLYVGASHGPAEPTEVIDAGEIQQNTLLGRNILDFLAGRAPLNDMLCLDINMDVVAALDAGVKSAACGQFVQVER